MTEDEEARVLAICSGVGRYVLLGAITGIVLAQYVGGPVLAILEWGLRGLATLLVDHLGGALEWMER